MPRAASGRSTQPVLAVRCAVIPGHMRARRSLQTAREELEAVAASAKNGLLGKAGKPDALANLWFIRAAHEYAAAATGPLGHAAGEETHAHLQYARVTLLPMCKRIILAFVSEQGLDSIRMDDGGMLGGAPDAKKPCAALSLPLRLNALWYAALEATGQALRGLTPLGTGTPRDTSGDHFERLAGRFRRSFAKAYWCEEHQRICPPKVRTQPDHCPLPDAEQLLLSVLPAGPVPRTKQRGIFSQLEAKGLGEIGVLIDHEDHGMVESPLHRAWLAVGIVGPADSSTTTPADKERAAGLIRPLIQVLQDHPHGLHAFYKNGKALGPVDPLTTAEVSAAIARFAG